MEGIINHLKNKNVLTDALENEIKSYYKSLYKNRSPDCFTWGKYKGKSIKEVYDFDRKYCEWFYKQEYASRVHKNLIEELMEED